jgi:hypothetical protein
MFRNLTFLCFCLLLSLSGCGLGRKTYTLEKDKNEVWNVVIPHGVGDAFRIRIPPGTTGSTAGTEVRNGVTFSWEVKYENQVGNVPKILFVKFNGEEIPPAKPLKAE